MAKPRTIVVTREKLVNQWRSLFARCPQLENLGSRGCGDVFCCPDDDGTLDWSALSEASGILFLLGIDKRPDRLSVTLVPECHHPLTEQQD